MNGYLSGWMIAVCVTLLVGGCTVVGNQDDAGVGGSDRAQVGGDGESGALTQEAIEGFEREIEAQYRQLAIHYRDYDRLRNADGDAAESHEEHRLHRKMKRRHTTLARLHEERLWIDAAGPSVDDREIARLHREAARWHEANYDPDGEGIVDQDDELNGLRMQLEEVKRAFRQ